jgi:hypothetical protein
MNNPEKVESGSWKYTCPECGKVSYSMLDSHSTICFSCSVSQDNVNPLVASTEQLFSEALETMKRKNADYATTDDVLSNFKMCEHRGNCSLEIGIVNRIDDKIARVSNLLKREAQVKDEKITDTIQDAINYLAILHYAIENKEK